MISLSRCEVLQLSFTLLSKEGRAVSPGRICKPSGPESPTAPCGAKHPQGRFPAKGIRHFFLARYLTRFSRFGLDIDRALIWI
jgi:hypothetical protein